MQHLLHYFPPFYSFLKFGRSIFAKDHFAIRMINKKMYNLFCYLPIISGGTTYLLGTMTFVEFKIGESSYIFQFQQ